MQSSADITLEDTLPTVIDTLSPEPPSSFDPLNGTILQNAYAISVLYEKPIDFDDFGRYRSSLLEKFIYSDETHTVQFCLKKNQFFSDGSPITLDDLAFSIARVAKAIPNLAHIKDIEGFSHWVKRDQPLSSYPKGFRLNRDLNCLNIHYEVSQPNPFYNFACNAHGIIPKSSVDLKSGQLKVSTPPFSGSYVLTHLDSNSYTLERRNTVAPSQFPEKIIVKIVSPLNIGPILNHAHKNTVIITDNASILPIDRETLNKEFRSPPEIEYFTEGLLFNPTSSHIFSDLRLRQFFAEEFRQSVAELGAVPSGSMFTLIQPGYVPLQELRSHIKPFTSAERETLVKRLKKHPPVAGSKLFNSFFQRIFDRTMQRFGIKNTAVSSFSQKELVNRFFAGQLDIISTRMLLSGLEPVNGPGLLINSKIIPHYVFIRENPVLRQALSKVYQQNPFTVDLEGAKNLSRLMYKDASYSVYRSFGEGIYVRKDSPLKFSTNFWWTYLPQLFREMR
jgi:hypothetical protein